jgi:TPR repeat protein
MNGTRPLLVGLLTALLAAPALAQPKSSTPGFPAPTPRTPQPSATDTGEPDIAYAEYQRGRYVSAFKEATRRVEEKNDPKAMTLLGEIYAEGLGVANDDKKAAEWYKLAAARGNREAMFALSMFRMTGRGGPADRPEGARLMAEAARLGHVVAIYDLGLLYLQGEIVQQDVVRAAELMRRAADAGNPEAQYALATFYKEGRGVNKDLEEAARLLGLAARSGHTDSEVEYGVALFNGTGVAKSEHAAAGYFLKAAQKNNPVGQSRLAWMYATGRGLKADPVEAARWHLIARAGGDNDQDLEDFMRNMKPMDRAMAESRAKPWIARMNAVGPTPFPTAPANQAKPQAVKP